MKREAIGYRPTWAEVNLKNIAYNFRQIKGVVSPQTKILATVKADAYGHGLVPVARCLAAGGIDYFGVASIDEGIILRQARVSQPILVLGLVPEKDCAALARWRLTPTVCTFELAKALSALAVRKGGRFPVHIKIDTGMSRVGVLYQDALKFIGRIRELKGVAIEGLFTHFAFADLNREFTGQQITMFNYLVFRLQKAGIHIPLIHSANSMGIVGYRESHFTMVRPGLIIYGLYPRNDIKLTFKPALSLKTKVIYCKKVPRGCGVSYCHTYITKEPAIVATLPIGYGDGYPRNLSNKAPVIIKGRRYAICGNVCMDQIMVDLGRTSTIKEGDEVVLIGSQGTAQVTVEELAALAGTIPYEIVCGLGSRIPRLYVR